jgi:hypothetical protein
MWKKYILVLVLMVTGTSFGQHLTYSELIGLLDIATDEVKVDEYLVKRGFEYSYGDSNEGVKNYAYEKLVGKDYYIAGVYYDGDINSTIYGYTLANESSGNVARWNYYKQIVSGYGYKQTNSETKENGYLWIYYQNKEYEITMIRGKIDSGPYYNIMIKKLLNK